MEQQSPAIKITLKQHPSKRLLSFNSFILNLNATKYNLSPFNSITGDLIKNNLRVIIMLASIVALSVAVLVSSALAESDKILDNNTYYSSIYFKRLLKYIKPFLDF